RGNRIGAIGNHRPALLNLNTKGAGAFVVVNEGGQTKENITRVRAVFADTDGADHEPIIKALPPHMVAQSSPGNFHIYWLTVEGFPLDQFTPIQGAISTKFGTDDNVKDLPRVMRLPGFKHNKYDPVDVTLLSANPNLARYTHEGIISGLGLTLHNASRSAHQPSSPAAAQTSSLADAMYSNQFSLIDLREMLKHIDPWLERGIWMRVCFAMAQEYGETGRDLFNHWSRGELWKERHHESF
ncbi:MAG TPA: hypothetical protein DCY55_01290, partial [Gammaproteobacteria bacterium]|nr:hypothetical protein [Gammaproteobacteria bacterium]